MHEHYDGIDAALILAGGKGEKTWPLTATRPKPLLPLPGDESILARLIRQVSRFVDRIYILTPPGEYNLFKEHLIEKGVYSNRVVLVEQPGYEKGYGSGIAAKYLLEYLLDRVGDVDRVLIINGDQVLHDSVILSLVKLDEYGLVAFRAKSNGRRYGVIVEEDGYVKDIIEKPGWSGEVLANSAIYLLPARLLADELKNPAVKNNEYSLPETIGRMIKTRGVRVRVVVVGADKRKGVGPWWDYLKVTRMVLEWLPEEITRGKRVECIRQHPGIYGNYLICGHVDYLDVRPPVHAEGTIWVSKGVQLGPYVRVRGPTAIYDDSKIASFVDVKASVILEDVKILHPAFIGDSVIAEHSSLGASTMIANRRLDGSTIKSCAGGRLRDTGTNKLGAAIGAYVRTGVNTSISPGTRIGPCTWLEEGAVARHDIPACSIVTRDGSIKPNDAMRECCEKLRPINPGLCDQHRHLH